MTDGAPAGPLDALDAGILGVIALYDEIAAAIPPAEPKDRTMDNPTRIGARGRALIENAEGCRLTAYPDPGTGGDPWTVGVGHTGPDVHEGLVITKAQADDLLRQDLARFERGVVALTAGHATNQDQYDALVSFAFNLGLGNLASSTLLKLHKAGSYGAAAAEFGKWIRAAGRMLPGLVRRRAAEAALYRGESS